MEATLAELKRKTAKVIRPVLEGGRTVVLTKDGVAVAQVTPTRIDRRAALAALRAIGPVKLPRRK